jgi:predicted alpha/beta hydrolase
VQESARIPARDGYQLAATLFRPDTANGRAVLVHAATGVKRGYYAKFADHLAARGFTVLTFDYRGIGDSRNGSLRGFKASMSDWAEQDAAGALDFLSEKAGGAKLLCVGHSFGGNGLGVVPGIERYAAALFVGTQSGYWRHWPGAGLPAMWLLTHLLLPSVSAALGYFPMKLLGQGEDLPGGVASEWASWCRNPRYASGVVGAEGYARLTAPIRSYWVSDDTYAPRPAAEALFDLYPKASAKELVPVDAAEHGGGIGHFGFFRERFRDTLWTDAADWLARQ